jgi:hypothetical protein
LSWPTADRDLDLHGDHRIDHRECKVLDPIGLELRSSGRFDTEWRAYLKLPPHKSVAIAGDVEGRYVIGYGFEKATRAAASSAAMEDCNLRRADKRIEDSCRIVAVDDEMIGDLIREE